MSIGSLARSVALATVAMCSTAHATVYDAAADFQQGWTTQSNPNDVWSYGYSAGFTSPVTLYNQTQGGVAGGPPGEELWVSPAVEIGFSPNVGLNNGPAFNNGNLDIPANGLTVTPGIGGQYSNLIFTAPAAGTYSLVSSFLGDQFGVGTLVAVLVNGNVLFNSSVTSVGQTVPFDTDVSLTAGETVQFSVGPGSGLQNTGVSATITPLAAVPAPLIGVGLPSALAMGGALLSATLFRRKRNRVSYQNLVGSLARALWAKVA